MIPRARGESQRAYVERALRTEGYVSAYDCAYNGVYEDGSKFGITRLAATIWTLRHVAGWVISEHAESGQLATYRLVSTSPAPKPSLPEWAQGWVCLACDSPPATRPDERLGGLALAHCADCGVQQHFRQMVPA